MHRWISRPVAGAPSFNTLRQSQFRVRQASLNSAIGRGIRRSQPRDSPQKDVEVPNRRFRSYRDDNENPRPKYQTDRGDHKQDRRPRETRFKSDQFDENEFIRSGNFRALPREHQSRWQSRYKSEPPRIKSISEKPNSSPSKSRAHRITETRPERVKDNVKVPDSIPYTTPASEFIYGASAVEAALRCGRRQIYKLYIYQGAGEELSPTKVGLRKLALSKNIAIKLAFAGWDRLLDKMSAGRPHNGCILEASPLPQLPVRAFNTVSAATEDNFSVELAPQTREEAVVNGTNNQLATIQPPVSSGGEKASRFPVVLLLDGIVDTGNMGAIIRSAYFLGIDAIILAGRNCAPLSPITIKASSGAAENMPLLRVRNEVDFIQRSQSNGWKFYAADAPGPGATLLSRAEPGTDGQNGSFLAAQSPSVLMMGSEASGLAMHIKSHADAIISIPGARHGTELGVQSDPARIDSLNVSVAAALLMEMFLRTPLMVTESTKKSKDKMW